MHKALVLFALLLGGCATSTSPNYDMRFGDAVREARMRQTLNPAPSTDPMAGMGGPAAYEAIGRYQDSFKAPPPVVNVINIGGAVGGSGN